MYLPALLLMNIRLFFSVGSIANNAATNILFHIFLFKVHTFLWTICVQLVSTGSAASVVMLNSVPK